MSQQRGVGTPLLLLRISSTYGVAGKRMYPRSIVATRKNGLHRTFMPFIANLESELEKAAVLCLFVCVYVC